MLLRSNETEDGDIWLGFGKAFVGCLIIIDNRQSRSAPCHVRRTHLGPVFVLPALVTFLSMLFARPSAPKIIFSSLWQIFLALNNANLGLSTGEFVHRDHSISLFSLFIFFFFSPFFFSQAVL